MWSRGLLLGLLLLSMARVGNAANDAPPVPVASSTVAPAENVNSDVKVLRRGILQYEFDPDGGALVLHAFAADGQKPLAVDSLEVSAIGDELERGRTIKAELSRTDPSSFRGTLNLSEGSWNLSIKLMTKHQPLEGQYLLGVGKSVGLGRFPLTPPNPEVGRLSTLLTLLLGIPLGLAVVVTIVAVLVKNLRPAKRPA